MARRAADEMQERMQMQMKSVFLDPGHGGLWRGECTQGLRESRQNLCVSNKAARILELEGRLVRCSHRGDSRLPPEGRVAAVKRCEPAALVVIHHSRRNTPCYVSVGGAPGAGPATEALAASVALRLAELGLTVRGLPCMEERCGDVLQVQESAGRAGIVVEFPLCIRCVTCRDEYARAIASGVSNYLDLS